MIAEKFNQCPAIFDFETPLGAVQCETYRGSRDALRNRLGQRYWRFNFRRRCCDGECRPGFPEKFPPGKSRKDSWLFLLFGFAHGKVIYEKREKRSRKNRTCLMNRTGPRERGLQLRH